MFQYAAMELEERSRRIVETAVELAEQGGFEAVRLRDVASHAGVALGTLYRRFRSKEDLLIAALEQETEGLERRILQRPPKGETPLERVTAFFAVATRALCRRPNLARALIRAVASGNPELAQRVAAFHERIERLIVMALRDESGRPPEEPYSEEERTLAWSINLVWFAMLVGWSGGLHSQAAIVDHTGAAVELMLEGARGHR
jgi:AcrR family transcriptional regulator